MPKNAAGQAAEVFQLKITLLGTDPSIWRRVLVPADMTLDRLHDALQIAMGWEDCHLHEFRIGRNRYGKPDPMDREFGEPHAVNERKVRLSEVLNRARATALYTYDFGDGWEHRIVLEKRLAPDPGAAYPACVAGERRGPPEDCGGIPGFYSLLETIADPDHEEHAEMLEWVGGGFDPNAFSVDEVNLRLTPASRRPGKAAGKS